MDRVSYVLQDRRGRGAVIVFTFPFQGEAAHDPLCFIERDDASAAARA